MFGMMHLHTSRPSSLQEVEQHPLSIHHLHDVSYIWRDVGSRQHLCFSQTVSLNVADETEVKPEGGHL